MAIWEIIDLIRLVLSREQIIEKTRYLFVLSSTPEGWRQFLHKHDPVGRFFRTRLPIGRLEKEDSVQTVLKTLEGTGVSFSERIMDLVWEHTQGHVYELQVLCSHLYEAQIEGRVVEYAWGGALENALRDLGVDYFGGLYGRVSERESPILDILERKRRSVRLKTVQKALRSKDPDFPIKSLGKYLSRLCDKELVERTGRGTYKILDRMFSEYVLRQSR